MKQLLTGLLLFIVASLLWIPITVINIILVMIRYINKHGFVKVLGGYFFNAAVEIDRSGNRQFRTLLNATLIKQKSYKFGNANDTISHVLGVNKQIGNLSTTGKILCFILGLFDKNHCIKSI